jgi:histidinol-phosphate aminotransferase
MNKDLLTPLAQSLPASVPFVGPEATERARGRAFLARLGANECVFGPSPRALDAMRAAASEAWMYGDPTSLELRTALADTLGCAPGEVVAGEGIDGLLGYLVRLVVGPGDTVVTSDGAYPTFNYHVTGFGGDIVTVPYRDDAADLDALAQAARESGAKLVYLANPDNPMASWHDAHAIAAFLDSLPRTCLLILDEAYVEFAPEGTAPEIDTSDPRLIRMRTFSKAYGMAGMRVGYAIGEKDLITAFEKVRNHFGMCRISQAAALAALADADWLATVKTAVARSRAGIAEIASEAGLTPLPSATNFVTIDCGQDAAFAKRVLDALIERDIFVRKPFAPPGDRCIRISCGTDEDLAHLRTALPLALAAADSGG